ncbi:MAG: hypothetical protein R2798_13095 [Chitinophagales bacterium]
MKHLLLKCCIALCLAGLTTTKALHAQSWIQLGADIDGEAADDWSGYSVAFSADGSRLAIGAPGNDDNGTDAGQVRVYDWSGSAWVQVGADIDGEAADDRSGWSVALSADGNRLAIGAYANDDNGTNAGQVRVYDWDGSAWVQVGADIDGKAAGDQLGWSVALSADGNRLAIGAAGNNGNGTDAGQVRVYGWNGSAWVQVGADIDGEAAYDWSGEAIDLSADGNRLAVGAQYNDGNGTDAGQVRVYDWSGSAWVQVGTDIDGEAADDLSGHSVALSADGNRLAIGAVGNDDNGTYAGQVRVYDWSGSAWVQAGADIDGEAAYDASGHSVALSADGNRLVIGAVGNDDNGTGAGQVRVYDWDGSTWLQVGADIDGEAANDASGFSVALSADGSRLAIGAPFNDGNGTSSGNARVFEFKPGCEANTGTWGN